MPITPDDLIANLGDLPPLPQVATRALDLAADPEATVEAFRQVVAMDPALAGQVLMTANTSAFGRAGGVATLAEASSALGLPTLRGVVIACSARSLHRHGALGPQERLLWEHAVATAAASRALAAGLRLPRPEEAYAAGLLHDLGRSVLALKFPERCSTLLREVHEEGVACLELEREAFGFDHATVGEALVRRWNLPPGFQAVLRWHHEPRRAAPGHRPLTAVVALGNQVALELKAGLGDPSRLEEASRQAGEILGLTPGGLASLREEVQAAVRRDLAALPGF